MPTAVRRGIVEFIDDFVKVNEVRGPFRLAKHQRTILQEAFGAIGRNQKSPWRTVIYSCPKKSGKTAINAAVCLAWAWLVEAPNEILILANSEEQARARVYTAMCAMIKHNPGLAEDVVGGLGGMTKLSFELMNGTMVKAVNAEAATQAGPNFGLASFDELWAYQTDKARLLWEELTDVPTRKNCVRFVTTYAGFEGTGLLWDLYRAGVGPEEYAGPPPGAGRRVHPTLPLYANEAAGILTYWDHEPRMAWQTADYYKKQKAAPGRASAYLRYHENRWAAGEELFITEAQWRACVNEAATPVLHDPGLPVIVGIDASLRKDSTAVVAVTMDQMANRVRLVNHQEWSPRQFGEEMDLRATVYETLRAWRSHYHMAAVVYDEWQMATIARDLAALGLPMQRYDQTQERMTQCGKVMFDLIEGRTLEVYPAPRLQEHALGAVAVETPRGFRIAKSVKSKKIDLFVALAMACHRALEEAGIGFADRKIEELAMVGAPAEERGVVEDFGMTSRSGVAPWEL